MPTLSICIPTYNEAKNIESLVAAVILQIDMLQISDYEIVIIDNASTDGTRDILRQFAKTTEKIKVVLNTRNFGHVRSPFYGMLQCSGDAVIYLAADFQDPPDLIPIFYNHWKAGYKVVLAQKNKALESKLLFAARKFYYNFLEKIASHPVSKNSTGFGLYDKQVINLLRATREPRPYVRGLIDEYGFKIFYVPFTQPLRKAGVSKNNLYTLIDYAILGITSTSFVPLRAFTLLCGALGCFSILLSFVFLFMKLSLWHLFPIGVAPLLIGLFFMFGLMLIFMSILAEYLNLVIEHVKRRPLVVEEERLNF
jgi:glycosyltransferase involved in cell wall biosynthesis